MARNDAAVRAKEELPLESVLAGEIPEAVRSGERPELRADLLHGQKTGIFLDQRENYRAAASYARGGKLLTASLRPAVSRCIWRRGAIC